MIEENENTFRAYITKPNSQNIDFNGWICNKIPAPYGGKCLLRKGTFIMDIDFHYNIKKFIYKDEEDILYGNYSLPCCDPHSGKYYLVFSESGFGLDLPDQNTVMWEIECIPGNETFGIYLYVPEYYVWKEKCDTKEKMINVFAHNMAQKYYGLLMSFISDKYSILKTEKMTVGRNQDGSMYLECKIPEEVFGKSVNVCAPDLDTMDVKLDEYRCKCSGPKVLTEYGKRIKSASIIHTYEKILEGSDKNYQPYYTDEYYADENFNDSPEYFKWLFGVLLDMAILGTIPMREFARRELIFLLFYGDELRETDIRDFQYEFVSPDTKEDEQPSEEQAKEEFRKIVDKAIKRRKQYDTNFTVEKLCFDTLHINNASFSRMKKGSVGISREMLLRIAVGIKMTQQEMRRAFFLKGMKFPVFKHEKVIDACIREGKGSMTELLALIPEEKRFGRAEKEK